MEIGKTRQNLQQKQQQKNGWRQRQALQQERDAK